MLTQCQREKTSALIVYVCGVECEKNKTSEIEENNIDMFCYNARYHIETGSYNVQ